MSKKIKFIVAKDGSYTMETTEGYVASQCESIKHIQQIIGGSVAEEKKTDDFYKPEDNYIYSDTMGI